MAEIKKAVMFKNIMEELFTFVCDGVEYSIPAGVSIMLSEDIARYGAKYLAMKKSGGIRMSKVDDNGIPVDSVIKALYAEIITSTAISGKSEADLVKNMLESKPAFTEKLNDSVKESGSFNLPEPTNEIEKIVNEEIMSISDPMKLLFNGKIFSNTMGFLSQIGVYRAKRIAELSEPKEPEEGDEDGDLGEEEI